MTIMKLQTLHVKYNKYPDQNFLILNHQYDVTLRTWRFKGYKCKHCSKTLKEADQITTHEEKCKVLNEVRTKLPTIPPIVTINGDDWKPVIDLGIIPV